MDSFYRLFVVPGMDHCSGGPGTCRFGQGGSSTTAPPPTKEDAQHNILLALVDWVEKGVAPDELVGTDEKGAERVLCRYPGRSVWDGVGWGCR